MSFLTAPGVRVSFVTRSGRKLILRPHAKGDEGRLLAFITDVKHADVEEFDPKWARPFCDADPTFSTPISCSLVAETRLSLFDRICGRQPEIVGHVYLLNFLGVAIHPRWRGEGIGPVLVSTLLDWARANPRIRNVRLQVSKAATPEAERARRFHERMGFVPDPEFHPDGPEMRVLYMRQRVKPQGYVLPGEAQVEMDALSRKAEVVMSAEDAAARAALARRCKKE